MALVQQFTVNANVAIVPYYHDGTVILQNSNDEKIRIFPDVSRQCRCFRLYNFHETKSKEVPCLYTYT